MAPTKRPRDSRTKNADKIRRRKRTNDSDMLYKGMSNVCGEECQQELLPVSRLNSSNNVPTNRNHERRRRDPLEDDELEIPAGDISNDDMENEVQQRSNNLGSHKATRGSKPKPKKSQNAQSDEMPLRSGVQRAKRYICEALDFGLQSGYLTLKDTKGKVMRVSSDLLEVAEPNRSRVIQRVNSDAQDARRLARKRRHASPKDGADERFDETAEVEDASRRRAAKKRGGSKRVKGRSRPVRSRTRSKSRRRAIRQRAERSGSGNTPEADTRLKQVKSEDAEQEDGIENEKEAAGKKKEDENDDNNSSKSGKNSAEPNRDDEANAQEKKQNSGDEDCYNDDGSDEDDDDKNK